MTDDRITLTRRKILASASAVGLAGAGAGLGTSALFSDTESFEGNVITAGTLDLLVGYYSYWDQGMAGSGSVAGSVDGETVSAELSDVKPGDSGLLAFCPQIDDNPAYLWLCGDLISNDENSVTEPEANAEEENDEDAPEADIDGDGELAQNVEVTVRYCEIGEVGDGFEPEDAEPIGDTPAFSGTLADLLDTGLPLDGDSGVAEPGGQACFDGTGSAEVENPCICVDWEVPFEGVGNEIQSDSVEFDLSFHAQQCRHNDGVQNPCGETDIPDVVSIQASPDTAGETDSIHRLEVPVGSGLDGETLSSITIDYPSDFGLGDVGSGDVLNAGVERSDTSIDSMSASGTTASDGDTAIEFTLGGSLSVTSGDTIFIEYQNVTNASSPDDYTVVVDVNGSEIGPGTLPISPETDSPGPITSTFETDDDGWQITGDAQGGAAVPNYETSQGNPAPSISATDDVQGGVWYFKAPGKFLGDKSGFYGGTLQFDLMQEFDGSPSQFDSDDIILEGGGLTMTYDTSQNPGDGSSETWTPYDVPLDDTGNWEINGSAASQPEIETVLGDLTELRIRGEYRNGSDTGYLDNVTLSP